MLAIVTLFAAPCARAATVDGTLFELVTAAGSTVDHIPFTVDAPGVVTIDVLSWEHTDSGGPSVDLNGDGEFAFFDPHIRVFADDGSLDAGDEIAGADNDDPALPGAADGSVSLFDPYLAVTLPAGDYLLAIGAFEFTVADAIADFNADGLLYDINPVSDFPRPGHDHGDYRITFSDNIRIHQPVPVPEPATVLMAGLSTLLVAYRRRRDR